MGKQMSKVGSRRNVHRQRQRSQQMSQPIVVANPLHFAPETTDRAILSLKLQRDELTVYKGHVQALLRKEEDVIRRLVKQGKSERAKLLLTKKRFQEHLIYETEKTLSSVLNQIGEQNKIPAIRKEVDQIIDRNAEAIKRLHMLLSLENVERLVEDTGEGSQKQSEVNRLLALATQAERELLDEGTDAEIQKLADSLALGAGSRVTPIPEETASPAIDPLYEDSDIEMLMMQKKVVMSKLQKSEIAEADLPAAGAALHVGEVAHQGDLVVDSEDEAAARGAVAEDAANVHLNVDTVGFRKEDVISTSQSTASSISEMTTAEVDADDEKSSTGGPSESQSQTPLRPPADISSSILPDVPTHSIEATDNNEAVTEAVENKQNVQAGGAAAINVLAEADDSF